MRTIILYKLQNNRFGVDFKVIILKISRIFVPKHDFLKEDPEGTFRPYADKKFDIFVATE